MSVVLSEHLPLLAGAPDGIQKLRGLILELAVRGKLVPQDPNDEPASELLKRIAKSRDPLLTKNDLPYSVPASWECVRFASIYSLEYGDNLPAPKRTNTGEFPVYGSNGIVGSHSECCVKAPCIVVGRKGSAGALNLSLSAGCWVTDVAFYCIPPNELDLVYSYKLFHTLGLAELGKGIKPGLSRSEAYVLPVAIPPLSEQHRIVAKVDELMALCDRLDAEQTDAASAHAKLVETLLGTLTQSSDADELAANWQRLSQHFDTLFSTETSLDALKKTILQLAVMGKLVPQDPNDEPASELLAGITATRMKLCSEKKIPKPKELPSIYDLELPFSMPEGWTWSLLGELCFQVSDGPHFSPSYVSRDQGIPFLSTRNVRIDGFDLNALKYISRSDHEEFCKRIRPETGDIIYTKGGTTGIAKVNDLNFEFSVWVHLAVLRIDKERLHPRYIEMALNSPHCYKQSQQYTQGISNFDLGLTRMIKITIPVPPLAEQHRIVAKVDELMTLCDRLKADLGESRARQARLSTTLIDAALKAA